MKDSDCGILGTHAAGPTKKPEWTITDESQRPGIQTIEEILLLDHLLSVPVRTIGTEHRAEPATIKPNIEWFVIANYNWRGYNWLLISKLTDSFGRVYNLSILL